MKYQTYFLTFFAYAAAHILRMSYSSIKPHFQKSFQLDSLFLGLFDGLVYISLGIGFFLRFLIQGHSKKTTIYLIFGIITACSYTVIPIMSLILDNGTGTIGDQPFTIRYVLPGISLILFGFGQFTAWPVLLYFVSHQFKQGTMLGIWSANGDFGNILGFLLSNLILKILNFRWQYVMITGAGIYFIFAFVISFAFRNYLKSDQIQDHLIDQVQDKKTRKDKFYQFLIFSKEIVAKHQNKMFLLALALLKAILYGFLLWMPTYLTHSNHADYSTYAPILFNVCTIFGSAMLGYFYKQKRRVNQDEYKQLSNTEKILYRLNKNLKSYSLFYACVIICGCFIIFFTTQVNILFTMILSGITGFFLGGAFNMLASNEVLSITHGDKSKAQILSTLSMAIGNVVVGIVEMIIGLALNVGKDFSKQTNLFVVLLIIGALASLIILIRSTIIYKQRRQLSRLFQAKQDIISQQF